MNSTSPTDPTLPPSFPLPRLIVRVGGLGNRRFGTDNGIEDSAPALLAAAEIACASVLDEIQRVLLTIHQDAPPMGHPVHGPDQPPWWKTHALGWVFGQADRWGSRGYQQDRPAVFASEAPLISLLSGDAEGADSLIRKLGAARQGKIPATVHYELLRVTPEDPAKVSDGLGVGLPAPKNQALQDKAQKEKTLSRADAHELATIVRRRAYAYRAQSEALRHHSDILLAIWDPDTEGKPGGTSESVEAALREQIPVIAIRITGPGHTEIHLLENLRQLRYLQGQRGEPPLSDWRAALSGVLTYQLAFPDLEPPGHAAVSGGASGHQHTATTAYKPRNAFATFIAARPLPRLWPDRLWKCVDTGAKVEAIENLLASTPPPPDRKTLEEELPKARQDQRAAEAGLFGETTPATLSMLKPSSSPDYDRHYEQVRKWASHSGVTGVYGGGHRGGIVLSYLLATLAVVLALLGAMLHL